MFSNQDYIALSASTLYLERKEERRRFHYRRSSFIKLDFFVMIYIYAASKKNLSSFVKCFI